jgi:hypothetical protein
MTRVTRLARSRSRAALWALALAPIAACGASSAESSSRGGADNGVPSPGSGDGVGGGTSTGGGGAGQGGSSLPPEQHVESSFGAPVATGRYVWIANPSSGRVAYIDAKTLAIKIVEAGNAPTYLAAVPSGADEDVAVVLNVLSFDATVLRAKGGALSTVSLPVASSGNAWAVSPDGRWATAWTDARRVASPDPIDGYQDVTVLDLKAGAERATSLAVGYRPLSMTYDASSTRAFAITQDGVSVIDLGGAQPKVAQNVALGPDPLEDASQRYVSITPDGAYALVRREGKANIGVVSLAEGTITDVTLPGAATDLALSADGARAVAVVRDLGLVALLPIPGIASAPGVFQSFTVAGTTVGSVVLAGAIGLLYTTALPTAALTAFDASASPPAPRAIKLRAPVLAVFPTADAANAIVLHDALSLEGGTKYAGALSVVPIAADLPSKILGLEAPPVSVAISPSGHRAVVATGDAAHPAYRFVVAQMPSQTIDVHPLASEPIAAGIVAGADRGFVAQKHPDGRITFVDFTTGGVQTLTGFELASQVVTGSTP